MKRATDIAPNFQVRHFLKSCGPIGKVALVFLCYFESVVSLFRNIPNDFLFIRVRLNVRAIKSFVLQNFYTCPRYGLSIFFLEISCTYDVWLEGT